MAAPVKVAAPRLGTPQADVTLAAPAEFILTAGAEVMISTSTQGVWVREGKSGITAASAGGAGCFLVPKDTIFIHQLVSENDRLSIIEDAASAKVSVTPMKGSMDKS